MLVLLRVAADAGIRPDFVHQLSVALRNSPAGTGSSGGSGGTGTGTGAGVLPFPSGQTALNGTQNGLLSERELHVLRLLATELSGPEIARELYVSLNTMRTHTKHIFVKLEVNSRAEAVRRGASLGLL
ncbi:LuxR C-terminal-related transcriptional regulator [Subtercola sp. PAMC28395]|uniref:response regulator transcription factor n=1 Tax=Subtercola sp. PAMC28395 TaxID=2846775 RepID=UPI001C0C446F|nr:LuxR C-terminal-related transcriptional regulator [Subtercola sp. PAMC28395]QWT23882.1 LuxR C-terminal-related transcriptional regulator [Subtercola sp. PAMC28395]